MKVLAIVLSLMFILSGCGSGNSAMNHALSLRSRLEQGGCEFDCVIIADYQEFLYEFTMQCRADEYGDISFAVSAPESISGVTGTLTDAGGKLTFDEKCLMFPVLSEGLPSPVSAPWIFMRSLLGGYICAAGKRDNGLQIQIDDTYEDNALKLDIYTDSSCIPYLAEIYWQGNRVISMHVENFRIL